MLSGREGLTTGMADNPINGTGPQGPLQLIVFLDDDLRRTYFSKRQVRELRQPSEGTRGEVLRSPAGDARMGLTVRTVGPIIAIAALRRVRPADLHHEHLQGAGARRSGDHRDHAALDQGRRHFPRLGHADGDQLDSPRRVGQDPHEADRSRRTSSSARRSPGSTCRASATRTRSRSWKRSWPIFPQRRSKDRSPPRCTPCGSWRPSDS